VAEDALMSTADPGRRVGTEARKTYAAKIQNGFIDKYLSGGAILDIGYKGYERDVLPIVPQAIGIDFDYPGYDGETLPFPSGSQDAVFSSHCLEHVNDAHAAIREWFRVLKIGGFLVICVPHQYLYEKRLTLPSQWNRDHRRFYTPATLMADIEAALEPNSYRVRHLIDNDLGYDYTIPPHQHPGGSYEIELVLEKIAPPLWRLANPTEAERKGSARDGSGRWWRRWHRRVGGR
jgi:SAM-dependent methyltransferase